MRTEIIDPNVGNLLVESCAKEGLFVVFYAEKEKVGWKYATFIKARSINEAVKKLKERVCPTMITNAKTADTNLKSSEKQSKTKGSQKPSAHNAKEQQTESSKQ